MTVSFRIVDGHGITPYGNELRTIERSIHYPLSEEGEQFSIIHGQRYDAFFNAMGRTCFIIALDDERVCGVAAFTWKRVIIKDQVYTGLYLADMKLAKAYRGKNIMLRLIWFWLMKWLASRRYRGWDFIFGAAMRDVAGEDVTRSFKGLHPGALAKVPGVMEIYFCSPNSLIKLSDSAPAYPSLKVMALLSQINDDIRDNSGLKEFRLMSSGQLWPLIHLPFPASCWKDGLAIYLKRCAQHLLKSSQYPKDAVACFALDQRLSKQRNWLADNGIQPGATCTVYDWSMPLLGSSPIANADYIHLSTSEI